MTDGTPDKTFEVAFAELEQVVSRLEDGRTTLDEALSAYEKGVALLKHCHRLLTEAEQKVLALTGSDEEGNPITTAFDIDN
jgi:exodeoxyribonuclease VII small subunit